MAPDGAASVLIAFPKPVFPNGVAVEADGSVLWDESYTGHVGRRRPDGTLEDLGRMPGDNPVLDGMKVGADGRIYVTDLVAKGIHVLAPDGKPLDFIATGGAPSNIAFDGETLWVTNAGVLAASTEPSTAGTIQRLRIPGGGAPTYKGVIRGSDEMSERTAFPGLSYQGMTCFVTGGGSGIGLETALTFADLGGDVAVLDRTPGAAAATVAQHRGARPPGAGDSRATPATRRPWSKPSRRPGRSSGRSTSPWPAPACSARAARCSRPRSPISRR